MKAIVTFDHNQTRIFQTLKLNGLPVLDREYIRANSTSAFDFMHNLLNARSVNVRDVLRIIFDMPISLEHKINFTFISGSAMAYGNKSFAADIRKQLDEIMRLHLLLGRPTVLSAAAEKVQAAIISRNEEPWSWLSGAFYLGAVSFVAQLDELLTVVDSEDLPEARIKNIGSFNPEDRNDYLSKVN